MTGLIIAAAQSCSLAGQIDINLGRHRRFMLAAAEQQAQLLLFPELSLTGYEPALAAQLAQSPDSLLLESLRSLARELRLTTVVGLPLRLAGSDAIYIAAWVLGADGSLVIYTKQHLHPGEHEVFTAGKGGMALNVQGCCVALSVCADFSEPSHAATAATAGAQVYATSALISERGYVHDSQLLQGYAAKHSMAVLMANHGGPSGGWTCAGRSAFWAPGGGLVVAAQGAGDCLVVVRQSLGGWQGQVTDLSF